MKRPEAPPAANPPPEAPPTLNLEEALLVEGVEKSELDKIIEMILDPKNIAHNTELTRNEITAFSVLGTIAKRHPQLSVLRTFLAENLILRVSKSRRGRAELIKILNRQQSAQEQMAAMEQRRGGWFGRKR